MEDWQIKGILANKNNNKNKTCEHIKRYQTEFDDIVPPLLSKMYYGHQKKKAAIIIIHNNKNNNWLIIKLLVKVLETEVVYVDMSAITTSYLNFLFS